MGTGGQSRLQRVSEACRFTDTPSGSATSVTGSTGTASLRERFARPTALRPPMVLVSRVRMASVEKSGTAMRKSKNQFKQASYEAMASLCFRVRALGRSMSMSSA